MHQYPATLPIAEIDPIFVGAIPICRELSTSAGPIDNFLVTPTGMPVLVECKLWRNPQARREVVGQILDYAKELSRWSSSDLQREVARRLGRSGDALLECVRAIDPTVDEAQFHDSLTANLRRGRFLLLIVGDGIREGVETIAEYIQEHAGLHFTLGLVELPIYLMPDGRRLITPRVLLRTTVITRTVVAVPDGFQLQGPDEVINGISQTETDPDRAAFADKQEAFWKEFLDGLVLDDPEQPRPKPARQGHIAFWMPAPGRSSCLTAYRYVHKNEVGLFLSTNNSSVGERIMQTIVDDWERVQRQLGGTARLEDGGQFKRRRIVDTRRGGSLDDPNERKAAFAWLRERVNTFINVLRPLVRAAAAGDPARAE